jgi:hypothetical protein
VRRPASPHAVDQDREACDAELALRFYRKDAATFRRHVDRRPFRGYPERDAIGKADPHLSVEAHHVVEPRLGGSALRIDLDGLLDLRLEQENVDVLRRRIALKPRA